MGRQAIFCIQDTSLLRFDLNDDPNGEAEAYEEIIINTLVEDSHDPHGFEDREELPLLPTVKEVPATSEDPVSVLGIETFT